MSDPLHRKSKQEDAEALALALVTCCAFSNSALTEDGVCCGANEFYFRVAEHYAEIEGLDSEHYKVYAENLEKVAKILDTLAEQFRTCAENVREAEHVEDDDDERMEAREDESRKETL